MAASASALFPMSVETAHSSFRSKNILLARPSKNYKTKTRKAIFCCVKPGTSSMEQLENEAMKMARKQFYDEITFRKKDANISLAKAALLISAEDEAYFSSNKEKDMIALQKEGRSDVLPPTTSSSTEGITLEGMSLATWLAKIDSLAADVQECLEPSANCLDILKAIKYLTKKSSLTTDPKNLYLNQVMKQGAGTAILLAILCIEVCQKLGLELHGAPLGEDFVLWPSNELKVNTEGIIMESQPRNEMIFEPCKGGKIWSQNADVARGFGGLNYRGPMLSGKKFEPVSNRTILTILLKNMKRMYWKRATIALSVTDITAPLHPFVMGPSGRVIQGKDQSSGALLRPHDLRLAVAASEKLLLLQPHDWVTRRDHGLLLFHSRRYGEALQELSICMAVAPVQEVQLLEPFVEKLHLLRIESSWLTDSYIRN